MSSSEDKLRQLIEENPDILDELSDFEIQVIRRLGIW